MIRVPESCVYWTWDYTHLYKRNASDQTVDVNRVFSVHQKHTGFRVPAGSCHLSVEREKWHDPYRRLVPGTSFYLPLIPSSVRSAEVPDRCVCSPSRCFPVVSIRPDRQGHSGGRRLPVVDIDTERMDLSVGDRAHPPLSCPFSPAARLMPRRGNITDSLIKRPGWRFIG